ncbi:MAG: transglutaminase family protein [Candidatus Dormibacteria bacterium]
MSAVPVISAPVLLEVTHTTRFSYSARIAETVMEVRARPLDGLGQRCLEFRLDVQPESRVSHYRDGFGNFVHYFNHLAPHQAVVVTARSVVETGLALREREDGFPEDFLAFRAPVLDPPAVRRMARELGPPDPQQAAHVELAMERLASRVHDTFEYQPFSTTVSTGVKEVMDTRRGVCQDFAHVFIAVARAMNVPARYVSGYVMPGGGRRGTGASHAWAEAFVPGRGWVGYDPTNPVLAGSEHVRVAVGRDYPDVPPTRGVYLGSALERLEVVVDMRRL